MNHSSPELAGTPGEAKRPASREPYVPPRLEILEGPDTEGAKNINPGEYNEAGADYGPS